MRGMRSICLYFTMYTVCLSKKYLESQASMFMINCSPCNSKFIGVGRAEMNILFRDNKENCCLCVWVCVCYGWEKTFALLSCQYFCSIFLLDFCRQCIGFLNHLITLILYKCSCKQQNLNKNLLQRLFAFFEILSKFLAQIMSMPAALEGQSYNG